MELLLISCAFLFALIAWLNLPIATSLMLALLPSYLLRAEVFGIPTTLLELMLIIIIVVWMIKNHHRMRELVVLQKSWSFLLALLVISTTISAIIAPNAMAALGIWKAYFIEPLLFFYLLKDLLLQSQLTSLQIYRSLLVGGAWVSLIAIYQWIFQTGIPIPWDSERRVTGVFDYPNALGLYLGPLAVLTMTQFVLSFTNRVKQQTQTNKVKILHSPWIYLSLFFLFFIAIILAQSEAAISALIITLIILGLLHPLTRKKVLVVVILLSTASLLIPFSRGYLVEKVTFQDYSEQIRISQWTETWELIKDHPVLGVGLSGYPKALVPYHQAKHIEIFQYPHNLFLNIWVELGLLGLMTFFYLLYLLVRPFFTSKKLLLPLAFCLLPLIQMFIHGQFDVPYFKNDLALLTWTILAIYYVEIFFKTKKTF